MVQHYFIFTADRRVLALLAGILVLAAAVYGQGYFKKTGERRFFSGFLFLFLLTVLGAVFSALWLGFLIFIELSTVALFILIAMKERNVAFRYLAVQLAGAAFLLAGIAGAGIKGPVLFGPVQPPFFPLLLAGLGVKSALLGLHFWLPEAHGKSPAPVSALLSGIAVKTGVFGLLLLTGGAYVPSLSAAGAAMALWGAFQALLQRDVKRLLAYSTISQLGYIVAALGAGGVLSVPAVLFHAVTHGLSKGMLFFCAGILEKAYGTKDFSRLGGAAERLPGTCILFFVAAASMIGLPGTAGFASKALVKASLIDFPLVSACLLVANIGTAMVFCKMGAFAFGDVQKSRYLHSPECFRFLNVGTAVLAPLLLFSGFFPGMLPAFLGSTGHSFYTVPKCGESLLAAACGVFLFLFLKKRLRASATRVRDIDVMSERFPNMIGNGARMVQRLQGGFLRGYLLTAALTALILMHLFS